MVKLKSRTLPKTSKSPTSTNTNSKALLQRAASFIEKGNYNQAIITLQPLQNEQETEEVRCLMRQCHLKLLRKFWRQNEIQQFDGKLRLVDYNPQLQLASARLKGNSALATLGQTLNNEVSYLAACSTQPTLKDSLLLMRKYPPLKNLAEGWLFLLNRDLLRAKAAFESAKTTHPAMANIALGVLALHEHGKWRAEAALSSLKTYAIRHYPQLAKAMHWGENKHQTTSHQEFLYYLTDAPLEELLEKQKSLPSQDKKSLSWIWLAIGDRFCSKDINKALVAWDKAKALNPKLKVDVLKRRYCVGKMIFPIADLNIAFKELYLELKSQPGPLAKQFLDHALFHSEFQIENLDNFSFLHRNDIKEWLKTAPIQEKMLWVHLKYHMEFKKNALIIGYKKPEYRYCSLKLWEELLEELLNEYGLEEKFLRYALCIYQEHNNIVKYVQLANQLLAINPHLKGEIIPKYTTMILEGRARGWSDEEEEQIAAKVGQLWHLYQSDFDLLRLIILFQSKHNAVNALLERYSTLLTPPLFAVLCLQAHIDQGHKLQFCHEFIPKLEQVQLSHEACWRLLLALATPDFTFPDCDWEALIDEIATDDDRRHEICSKIYLHGGVTPPLRFLNNWKSQSDEDWRVYFHMGMYYGIKGDYEELYENFEDAEYYAPLVQTEYAMIQENLEYHY